MKVKNLSLARPEIIKLKPYCSELRKTHFNEIYLNANENHYVLSGYEKFNYYPDEAQSKQLLQTLGAIYNVSSNKIIATRGADEAIELLIRAFCRAYKDKIIICPPTYSMYEISANIQSAKVVMVPLLANDNFKLDANGIIKAWKKEVKLIFLCSPNNPTGNILETNAVLKLCKKLTSRALVVVDEAYMEFSDATSFINFIDKYPNLVILRTLSKFYGLAGLRCGVAITNSKVINLLQKIIAPYPLPAPIIDMVSQYFIKTNLAKIKANGDLILQAREQLYKFLLTLPFVKKVWQSHANFLLVKVDDARRIINLCKKNNIIIRSIIGSSYGLKNCVRISIGTLEENKILMEVLAHA